MKKKQIFYIFLIVCVLIPVLSFAKTGVQAVVNQNATSYSGPGARYTQEGTVYASHLGVTAFETLQTTEQWAQVEKDYGGEKKRFYVPLRTLNIPYSLPQGRNIPYACNISKQTVAYYGPSYNHAKRSETL